MGWLFRISGVLAAACALTACGGSSDKAPAERGDPGSLETAAAALTARLGPQGATGAVVRALDRGYSYEQIVAAGTTDRLKEDGQLSKPDSDELEAPARTPLGRYTLRPTGPRFVALEPPRPRDVPPTGAREEGFDRLMLALEFLAEGLKKGDSDARTEAADRPPVDYSALVVILEMARVGYSADEIFLALADEAIAEPGRVLRKPANDGWGIIILNPDGSAECPEGAAGEYCRSLNIGPREAPTEAIAPTAAPSATAPPQGRPGCVRGRIAFDEATEKLTWFLGYGSSPNLVELCIPPAGGPIEGTFTFVYDMDVEEFFRGSTAPTGGPCKTRTSAAGVISGSVTTSGGALSGTANVLSTPVVTVLEGCTTSDFSEQEPDQLTGPITLSGNPLNGSFNYGGGALRFIDLR